MAEKAVKRYTVGEEIFNAVTHGVGAALGIAGTVILLVYSDDAWKAVSSAIYGGSMILLFLMSCLYHAIAAPRAKKVFRVFDHTSIFLLIAGTYTPFTLITLRGWVGWTLFGIVWACAVGGIVLNSISNERFRRFSQICYIASGWCIVIAFVRVGRSLALPGIGLLLAGGVAYTVGVFFYRDKKRRYVHSVWHLFVLAGAVLHYLDILQYVIRA